MCDDGAPAVLGNNYRFSALIEQEIPHLQVILCFFHCPALASKALPLTLKKVLDNSVKIIN